LDNRMNVLALVWKESSIALRHVLVLQVIYNILVKIVKNHALEMEQKLLMIQTNPHVVPDISTILLRNMAAQSPGHVKTNHRVLSYKGILYIHKETHFLSPQKPYCKSHRSDRHSLFELQD
jgi:hypothetical protein